MATDSAPDVRDLRGALTDLPDRLASLATGHLPSPSILAPESVVVCAAGDDALDAAVVEAAVSPEATVPLVVHRGEVLPGFLGAGTLVVVFALTRFDERSRALIEAAGRAGSHVAVVTASDEAAALAITAGAEVIGVDAALLVPRLLPGVGAVLLLRLLSEAGVSARGEETVRSLLAQVRARTGEYAVQAPEGRRSAAAALARRLERTMLLCYGGGETGAVAAGWWKSTVNQSAKQAAFARGVPEMSHDELAGFGQSGDVTRQVFTAVLLRHEGESKAAADHLDRLPGLVDEVVARVESVTAEGSGTVAQVVDLAVQGQWVALEMAAVAGVDPSAVPLLDEFWAADEH